MDNFSIPNIEKCTYLIFTIVLSIIFIDNMSIYDKYKTQFYTQHSFTLLHYLVYAMESYITTINFTHFISNIIP